MTDPGMLNRRLVLEAPVETADGAGGVIRSFAALTTVWAAITPAGARGDFVADDAGATVTHRIVIRWRTDLTARHRARLGERIFRFVSLRDQDGAGRFLLIEAEERTD
jgi:SPP1 family predicted phage head-tail adaptor